jgi:hypothetical protein
MSDTPEQAGLRQRLDRRMVIAIAAGLVVLLVVAWLLVLRGSPESAPSGTGIGAPPSEPAPAAAPERETQKKQAHKAGGGPVETFQVFAPRDPFDPLVSASSGGTGSASTTSASTGTTTGTISNGGQSGGESPSGGTSVSGHTVSVVDVFNSKRGPRAQLEVDGTVYTVDEGERFGGSFRLVSATQRCAGLLYGDDQFTLCEGEQILK